MESDSVETFSITDCFKENVKAKYKCLKCGYEYESNPCPTQCPKCRSLYVKWVNYDEWRNKVMKPKYGDLY